MIVTRRQRILLAALVAVCACPYPALAQVAVLEIYCSVCGYRQKFIQGIRHEDRGKNVQHIIVVCERAKQIRNIAIPLDSEQPVEEVPLLARQYGTGTSELLGIKLPRFHVPGNTCPLLPISAYLERSTCPIHRGEGLRYAIVGQY
jgi:hypothetical protein